MKFVTARICIYLLILGTAVLGSNLGKKRCFGSTSLPKKADKTLMRFFAFLDGDGNGVIDNRLRKDRFFLFNKTDSNRDKVLSRNELNKRTKKTLLSICLKTA
jgi:hypothetical protein